MYVLASQRTQFSEENIHIWVKINCLFVGEGSRDGYTATPLWNQIASATIGSAYFFFFFHPIRNEKSKQQTIKMNENVQNPISIYCVRIERKKIDLFNLFKDSRQCILTQKKNQHRMIRLEMVFFSLPSIFLFNSHSHCTCIVNIENNYTSIEKKLIFICTR